LIKSCGSIVSPCSFRNGAEVFIQKNCVLAGYGEIIAKQAENAKDDKFSIRKNYKGGVQCCPC
jgi:hypothetical protein